MRGLFSAALIAVLPATAGAVDCEVNPYTAWQTAQARGWEFHCFILAVPGAVTESVFNHEPPDRIGCRWRTGPVPSPITPRVQFSFFDNRNYQPSDGALRNGWRITDWRMSNSNYEARPPLQRWRIVGDAYLTRTTSTYRYRLTRLVLSRDGGTCANALNEAF